MVKVDAASVGSAAFAVLAHVPCCGLNIALLLGGTAAGTSWLHGLEPMRPWLVGLSLGLASLTLFLAYRPHKEHGCGECCHEGAEHRRRQGFRKAFAIGVACLALAGLLIPQEAHDHNHPTTSASRTAS